MELRKATTADRSAITHALARKGIDYITPALARSDIDNGYMYLITDCNKIIAICSLLPNHRGYTAIKRLCVLNNKNRGRGVAHMFFDYFCSLGLTLGATPWSCNNKMLHIMDVYGFEYQYTFNENYMFYLKK